MAAVFLGSFCAVSVFQAPVVVGKKLKFKRIYFSLKKKKQVWRYHQMRNVLLLHLCNVLDGWLVLVHCQWLLGHWETGGSWCLPLRYHALLRIFFTSRCFNHRSDVVTFGLSSWMPESPRWLVSRGRVKDSIKVLNHIANVNGTTLPENAQKILEEIAAKKEKAYGIPSLFSNKQLAKITLMNIICW